MNRSLISIVVMGLLAIGFMELGRRSLDRAARERSPESRLREVVDREVGGRCSRAATVRRSAVDGVTTLLVEVSPFGAFDPERLATQVVDALESARDQDDPEPGYTVRIIRSAADPLEFEARRPWQPKRRFRSPGPSPDPSLPAAPPGR